MKMIGSKCLLDTSIVIDASKANNTIGEQLDNLETFFLPTVVAGELYFGAYKSNNAAKHIKQIQPFINNCKILHIDIITAEVYASIKADLSKKGKPIPENDLWIAAISIQHNIPLFTTDNHFKEIDSVVLF